MLPEGNRKGVNMAKRIICAIISLIFVVSMVVIPASAETTENGYQIPDVCLATDEPDVTNFCFELKRVHPGYVKKDGVIGENEYFLLNIPEEEIILKGSNNYSGEASEDVMARSQFIREHISAYASWDYEHGVNVAIQYTSPETPKQEYLASDYNGRLVKLDGSTPDHPLRNDSFHSDGVFEGPGEHFWGQTAFTFQSNDKNETVFYYGIGRNTETLEYLMGHYFFRSVENDGKYQYGYDKTYIPVGGTDFIITYGENNLVTMEWSIPLSSILGRDPEDGEKVGISMTVTQGTNPSPDEDQPWNGDLINNAAVLLGNTAGFQSNAVKPTRQRNRFVDPVTDKTITAKRGGNLPMVAIFNTSEPTGPAPVADDPDLSASLTLNDSIDVNFYVDGVTADMASSYSVQYSLDNVNFTDLTFADGAQVEDGKYVFTPVTFTANQLANPVYFKVLNGDGEEVKSIEYSVKAYCDAVIGDTSADANQDLQTLCYALMAYGYFAQQRFADANNVAIDPGEYLDGISAAEAVSAEDMGNYTVSVNPAKSVSASLALRSKTELSFYFKGVTSVSDVSVFVGGTPWDDIEVGTVRTSNGNQRARVIVKGLNVLNLASDVEVVCDAASVTYSPMAYAKTAIKNETADADVCKALVNFYLAAVAYSPIG